MDQPTRDERWEELKPIITDLYLEKSRKLSEIATELNETHGFNASLDQYKHRIHRLWKLRKSLRSSEKAEICSTLRRTGRNVTTVRYQGKSVNSKLRRYVKDSQRKRSINGVERDTIKSGSSALPSAQRDIFRFSSNTPVEIARMAKPGMDVAPTIPSVISIQGEIKKGTAPLNLTLDSDPSSSSLWEDLMPNSFIERSRMLLDGKFEELQGSLNADESRAITTWLHQFWLFTYKTAKYWGRGPHLWTPDLLSFEPFQRREKLLRGPMSSLGHQDPVMQQNAFHSDVGPRNHANPLPESWTPWPESWVETPFMDTLRAALQTNVFSTVPLQQLPFSVPEVLASPNYSLFADSLSFAIMAGNPRLVHNVLKPSAMHIADILSFFPFHLAATYLDGTKGCCQIFHTLVCGIGPQYLNQLFVNNLGHTVLDCLMISILKSHTVSSPREVDTTWAQEELFPGAEVDLCGRWDADSKTVRDPFNDKQGGVPNHLKNHFCHTSVQTICHCMRELFASERPPDINHLSGLFARQCAACGLNMRIRPLHTLVLTAAHLNCNGILEEFFGMIACAFCLLSHGADARLKATISIPALLGQNSSTVCTHEDLTPGTLARRLTPTFERKWTEASKVGWEMLWKVLDNSVVEAKDSASEMARVQHGFVRTRAPHYLKNTSLFNLTQTFAMSWQKQRAASIAFGCCNLVDAGRWHDLRCALFKSLEVGGAISCGHLKRKLPRPLCWCRRFNEDSERDENAMTRLAESSDYDKEDWIRFFFDCLGDYKEHRYII